MFMEHLFEIYFVNLYVCFAIFCNQFNASLLKNILLYHKWEEELDIQ